MPLAKNWLQQFKAKFEGNKKSPKLADVLAELSQNEELREVKTVLVAVKQ
ncbi:hypothetical protein GARC_4367 [Paraglaciecola arctica BSs20135]|uniref:Uncharacterized protein n=1 Tax=Paraglaciecola arctica BSs20135 TaxID=493475 RepID=K6XL00_9ALTE|nr:hypothetical protein GARC_4367 [Paraglaciecola arctica BSs20135]